MLSLLDSVQMEQISLPSYRHCSAIIQKHNNTLWLGDLAAAQDTNNLHTNNIKTVITAAQGLGVTYDKSIIHHTFPLSDSKRQNILQYLDKADSLISAGLKVGSVLVHCAAGVSRSTTLVIAYLMKSHRMSFHEALRHCRKHRPEVCPNIGFERQLKIYERNISMRNMNNGSYRFGNVNQNRDVLNSSTLPGIMTTKSNTYHKKLDNIGDLAGIGCSGGGGWSRLTMKNTLTDLKDFHSRGLTPMQKRENYLRQVAQFRFGITSLSKFSNHNHF